MYANNSKGKQMNVGSKAFVPKQHVEQQDAFNYQAPAYGQYGMTFGQQQPFYGGFPHFEQPDACQNMQFYYPPMQMQGYYGMPQGFPYPPQSFYGQPFGGMPSAPVGSEEVRKGYV